MKNISVASIVAVVISLCACATQPAPQPTVAKAPTPPVAAPPAASSSAPASADQKKIEIANYARSAGYRPVMRNGNQVWCKSEAPLGSNLAKPSCVNDDVILDQKRLAAQGQQDILSKRNCGGPTCNGS